MPKSRPLPPAQGRRIVAGENGITVTTKLEFPAGVLWADVYDFLDAFDRAVHQALIEDGWRA